MTKDKPAPPSSAPENKPELARYIADMIVQLESMAISARLDTLAYYLSMVRLEGETAAQGNVNLDTPE